MIEKKCNTNRPSQSEGKAGSACGGIKIFADGADINGMVEMYRAGFISGLTTNPSLMKKAGITDYGKFAQEAVKAIPDLPLSFEVFSDDFDTMEKEAKKIGSWGENIYIKIPITNSKGQSSAKIINKLSREGLKLNVTAIMTIEQVKLALENLTPGVGAYISVFAGRIADTGIDPCPMMTETARLCKTVPGTESLWASTREVVNIFQAKNCGVDIITVTNDILKKLSIVGKDLTEYSLETVQMFYNDALSLGFTIL